MKRRRTFFSVVLVILLGINVGLAVCTIVKISSVKKVYEELEWEMSKAPETVKKEETSEKNMTESEISIPRDMDKFIDRLVGKYQMDTEEGQWSVSIQDLNTDTVKSYHGERQLTIADDELRRIFIMATVYSRAVDAKLPIEMNEEYEGEARDLLEGMIQDGDMDAEDTILSKLGDGLLVVNNYCQENEYNKTLLTSKSIQTSSDNSIKLLSSIYSGTGFTKESSEKMLAILTGSKDKSIAAEDVNLDPVIGSQSVFTLSKDNSYILCILYNGHDEDSRETTEKIIKETDKWFSRH